MQGEGGNAGEVDAVKDMECCGMGVELWGRVPYSSIPQFQLILSFARPAHGFAVNKSNTSGSKGNESIDFG
jgi:hypothetical protein